MASDQRRGLRGRTSGVARRRSGRRSPGTPRVRPSLDPKAAKLAAFELLARKAWSRRELAGRLRRRGAPAEVADTVVAELAARGYVDDASFAQWWAQARARGRRIGSVRLRQELRHKGIPPELAGVAIRAAFEEASESERALEAARRRLPALRRAEPARAPARLRDYLLRRGYPPSIVAAAVRALLAAELAGAGDPETHDDASV